MDSEDHAHMDAIPPAASEAKNPTAGSRTSAAAGERLFQANCVRCHGAAGRGDGPDAGKYTPGPADLLSPHTSEMTDGQVFWIIANGSKETAMPAWKASVSESQIWDLVNFIRTLRQ